MKVLYTIILTGTLLLFTSCNPSKRYNYIILIDNSKSISEQLLNHYLEIIENTVIPNLGRNDRLTIQFIDECVMTRSERIFSIDLDKLDFTNSRDGLNNKDDSVKVRLRRYLIDSVKPQVASAIRIKRNERIGCGDYTDIINSLNEAQSLIVHEKSFGSAMDYVQNSAKGVENYEYENVFILFSDMVQENRDQSLDFTQMGKLNAKQVFLKIENIRNLDKIPDLSGGKVFIYGATASENAGPFANKQIENVRLFWETYFKDSNAELQAYSFDCKKEITAFMVVSRN